MALRLFWDDQFRQWAATTDGDDGLLLQFASTPEAALRLLLVKLATEKFDAKEM